MTDQENRLQNLESKYHDIDKRQETFETYMKSRQDSFETYVKVQIEKIDEQMRRTDERINRMEERMDRMEAKVDSKFDKLSSQLQNMMIAGGVGIATIVVAVFLAR